MKQFVLVDRAEGNPNFVTRSASKARAKEAVNG